MGGSNRWGPSQFLIHGTLRIAGWPCKRWGRLAQWSYARSRAGIPWIAAYLPTAFDDQPVKMVFELTHM
eukprot:9584-Amphidinium_carterae.1